jgi:hypothetical protein
VEEVERQRCRGREVESGSGELGGVWLVGCGVWRVVGRGMW